VTFSAGVATNKDMNTFIEQIKMADVALYKAKKLGRNRVCTNVISDESI